MCDKPKCCNKEFCCKYNPSHKIDWTKPVRTAQDHCPVEIICTDLRDESGELTHYPVLGVAKIGDGKRSLTWTLDGAHLIGGGTAYDLENVPEGILCGKFIRFFNLYESRGDGLSSGLYSNEDTCVAARQVKYGTCVTVKITYDNGNVSAEVIEVP